MVLLFDLQHRRVQDKASISSVVVETRVLVEEKLCTSRERRFFPLESYETAFNQFVEEIAFVPCFKFMDQRTKRKIVVKRIVRWKLLTTRDCWRHLQPVRKAERSNLRLAVKAAICKELNYWENKLFI